MDFKARAVEGLSRAVEDFSQLRSRPELHDGVAQAAEWITEAYRSGGRLFIAGNGGSAADAQHIAAELVGKLDRDRTPLPAFAMTVDSSLLTAVGNDYGYDQIFSRQVMGLMTSRDIFWGLTTSGNSTNVVKALEACRKVGARSVVLTGKSGGTIAAQDLADLCIVAPGSHTASIQQAHMAIYHVVCFMVEQALVESGHVRYF